MLVTAAYNHNPIFVDSALISWYNLYTILIKFKRFDVKYKFHMKKARMYL